MIATREDTERLEAMVAEYVAVAGGVNTPLPDVVVPLMDYTEDMDDVHLAAVLAKAVTLNRVVAPVRRACGYGWYDSVVDPWQNVAACAVPCALWNRITGKVDRWYKCYPTALEAIRDLGRVLIEMESKA